MTEWPAAWVFRPSASIPTSCSPSTTWIQKMKLTANEKRTVKAVFNELLKKPYQEVNGYLGNVTISEMAHLYQKLRYEQYCDERGIRYEDMTDEDFVSAEEQMRREDCEDCED